MAYTEEDAKRSIAKRSNGHRVFYNGLLSTRDSKDVRNEHLSDFARVLDRTPDLSLQVEAVEYINGILKGDRHFHKERVMMKRSDMTSTIGKQEKGFFGRIKRGFRKIKDVFKPSDRKVLEDSVSRLARDIARFPDNYAGKDVYALFDGYNIRHDKNTRENVQYSINRNREKAAKLRELRSSRPASGMVAQHTISREMLAMRTANSR